MENNLKNIESFSLSELTKTECEQINGGGPLYQVAYWVGAAVGGFIGLCSYLGDQNV